MGLIRSGMVETAAGTNALSLEMQAGRSARIRDIRYSFLSAAAEDFTAKIGRKSIMQFKAPSGYYLLAEIALTRMMSIWRAFRAKGVAISIPVGEGETFGLTAPGSNNFAEVVYDLYDAEDVSPSEPNGSKSREYHLFQMISNTAAPTESGDEALDFCDLDSQFPNFPAGEVVPAGTEMRLLGLFGSPVTKGDTSNQDQITTHLKFLADREDIFDMDMTGLLYQGDVSHVAATTVYAADASRLTLGVAAAMPDVIVYDDPIVFGPGTELNVLATILETTAANDIAAKAIKLGLLFNVVKL